MPLLLALDQGTTSSRAIAFDESGAIRAAAQRELPQHFPRPGWVEHDPAEIRDTQLAVAREAIASLGASARDVAAIGIANQRETVLLWDRATGEPVHRAIVWQDRRTAGFCEALRHAGHAERIARRTGLVLDAYFSASKLRWLLDHVPGARARAERGELAAGTVDTWLLWQLTGGTVHATDPTNASRTMLYSLADGGWDDELLALFCIPRAVLPRIAPSSGVIGETAGGLLGAPVPIAGVAGDQQAAMFGQGCFEPGRVKTTYGTGCFMLMPTGGAPVASAHRLLSTAAASPDGRPAFALEGSVFVAGAVVQWLRDQLGLIKRSADVEALAATVPDSGGVVLVPAFTGLGAPHWDSSARGTVCGLTRSSSAGHVARAALESIAFQVADLLEGMRADSGDSVREMRVDGGAAVNDLLMQFQADVLGVPTVRPAVTETTALGAAYLAGLAIGVWPDAAALESRWRAQRTFEPAMSADAARSLRSRWTRAVARARGWEEAEPAG